MEKQLTPNQTFEATIIHINNYEVVAFCDELHNYGYYQGEVTYESTSDDDNPQLIFNSLGIYNNGDKVLLKAIPCDPNLYGEDITLIPIKKL